MNGQNSTKKKNAATTAALIAVVVLVMAGVFVLLYVTALAPLMQKRPAPTPQETVQEQPEPQLPTTPAVPEADKPEADAPQTETHPDTEMQPVEPEQEPEPAPEAKTYPHAEEDDATRTLDLEVYSEGVLLIDAQSNTVVAEKNPDARIYPASMTKVMTALVVLEQASLDDTITVTQAHMAEGSSMYLKPGETVRVEELLYGLLLCSGNDAALALTECAGGAAPFVALMNEKAAALGMAHTSFANPNGLDAEGHYSTARDMAALAAAAMDDPTFRRLCSSRRVTIGQRTMENHNRLLRQVEGCVGLKTGYTKAAGRTLVSCAERNGCRLVVVTLRDGDDWADHAALYEYGFRLTAPRMAAQQVLERLCRTAAAMWNGAIQQEGRDA